MQNGWECQKCHNVYAPNIPFCLYCWFQQSNTSEPPPMIQTITPQVKGIPEPEVIEEISQTEEEKVVEEVQIEVQEQQLLIDKVDIIIPSLNKELTKNPLPKFPDTKIFLSGIGHAKERAINRDFRIPYVLDTIMDFPRRPTPMVYKYFDYIKSNKIEYLLDSGAFSYMTNPKKKIDINDLLDKYITYINEFDIQNYFEMDLDVLYSLEDVENFRRKLYKETSKHPIVIWHDTRGEEYWDNMCKDSDFIAYGGLAVNASLTMSRIDSLAERVERAHRYGTKVHGLGFCPLTLMNAHELMFDTVDTTSWNTTKQGNESIIDERGQLQKVPMQFYYSSIEPQEKCLKTWATFATNYKGKSSIS